MSNEKCGGKGIFHIIIQWEHKSSIYIRLCSCSPGPCTAGWY